ncbi:gluconokinase [Janthinobacterium sp. Mn2066]|uniref:gluconokinase n=1 Tax=Janthinobacterium sp. Mn2066 TaxID=3395264 RepID=UPI003BD55A43
MSATEPRWVVMGVSGCGKSFIGSLLASRLKVDYVEGDELHPPENVAKMAAGVPLTDADRAGWLAALRDRIARARAQGIGLVVSCSALKRAYRDLLREGDPGLRFAHLDGPREILLQRMQERQHFMPASLLDSQLQTLQPLQADEAGLVLDFRQAPDELVKQLLRTA